jgi:hypothetical protein
MIQWLRRPPFVCMLWLLGLWLLYSVSQYYVYEFEGFFPPPLGAPPTWNGITPGHTDFWEAREILGDANRGAQRRGNYWVYQYEDRHELGWNVVELWTENRQGQLIVAAIWRDFPVYQGAVRAPHVDIKNLGDLAMVYQKPDQVLWSGVGAPDGRSIIWARHGAVAVIAPGRDPPPDYDWSQAFVYSVLLTEPMGTKQLLYHDWPWPRGSQWYMRDPFANSPTPSVFGRDPIDWDAILESLYDNHATTE